MPCPESIHALVRLCESGRVSLLEEEARRAEAFARELPRLKPLVDRLASLLGGAKRLTVDGECVEYACLPVDVVASVESSEALKPLARLVSRDCRAVGCNGPCIAVKCGGVERIRASLDAVSRLLSRGSEAVEKTAETLRRMASYARRLCPLLSTREAHLLIEEECDVSRVIDRLVSECATGDLDSDSRTCLVPRVERLYRLLKGLSEAAGSPLPDYVETVLKYEAVKRLAQREAGTAIQKGNVLGALASGLAAAFITAAQPAAQAILAGIEHGPGAGIRAIQDMVSALFSSIAAGLENIVRRGFAGLVEDIGAVLEALRESGSDILWALPVDLLALGLTGAVRRVAAEAVEESVARGVLRAVSDAAARIARAVAEEGAADGMREFARIVASALDELASLDARGVLARLASRAARAAAEAAAEITTGGLYEGPIGRTIASTVETMVSAASRLARRAAGRAAGEAVGEVVEEGVERIPALERSLERLRRILSRSPVERSPEEIADALEDVAAALRLRGFSREAAAVEEAAEKARLAIAGEASIKEAIDALEKAARATEHLPTNIAHLVERAERILASRLRTEAERLAREAWRANLSPGERAELMLRSGLIAKTESESVAEASAEEAVKRLDVHLKNLETSVSEVEKSLAKLLESEKPREALVDFEKSVANARQSIATIMNYIEEVFENDEALDPHTAARLIPRVEGIVERLARLESVMKRMGLGYDLGVDRLASALERLEALMYKGVGRGAEEALRDALLALRESVSRLDALLERLDERLLLRLAERLRTGVSSTLRAVASGASSAARLVAREAPREPLVAAERRVATKAVSRVTVSSPSVPRVTPSVPEVEVGEAASVPVSSMEGVEEAPGRQGQTGASQHTVEASVGARLRLPRVERVETISVYKPPSLLYKPGAAGRVRMEPAIPSMGIRAGAEEEAAAVEAGVEGGASTVESRTGSLYEGAARLLGELSEGVSRALGRAASVAGAAAAVATGLAAAALTASNGRTSWLSRLVRRWRERRKERSMLPRQTGFAVSPRYATGYVREVRQRREYWIPF